MRQHICTLVHLHIYFLTTKETKGNNSFQGKLITTKDLEGNLPMYQFTDLQIGFRGSNRAPAHLQISTLVHLHIYFLTTKKSLPREKEGFKFIVISN